jgi:predicted PhzF superfamily epimerase YddE/YHI9
MPQLHLLRVFCSEDGSGGNPLGVFADGPEVPPERRQAVAADLGLSETVFVDDSERGEVRILTPAVELDFAGHPAVGAASLLQGVDALRTLAGEVAVSREGPAVFVAARPEWGPPWKLVQLGSPEEVDALDEAAGRMRVRVFGVRIGIAEDEATGSAATKLCVHGGRPIDIRQGRGSRIQARPGGGGFVEIGGLTVVDDVRDYALP